MNSLNIKQIINEYENDLEEEDVPIEPHRVEASLKSLLENVLPFFFFSLLFYYFIFIIFFFNKDDQISGKIC